MIEYIHPISILLEIVIAVIAIMAAQKGHRYMYGFAITFAIYVFYDTVRYLDLEISPMFVTLSFFVATVTALYSTWCIYKQK